MKKIINFGIIAGIMAISIASASAQSEKSSPKTIKAVSAHPIKKIVKTKHGAPMTRMASAKRQIKATHSKPMKAVEKEATPEAAKQKINEKETSKG